MSGPDLHELPRDDRSMTATQETRVGATSHRPSFRVRVDDASMDMIRSSRISSTG